ncbi:MAG: tetratricopeptide repeat protein, partial [Planctomycetota bacterium]|jgi:tetratricopeptide (TPR) repeat protein
VAVEPAGEQQTAAGRRLELAPLDIAASEALLDELSSGADLPTELRRSILNRAGGLPLLLEELIEGLVESAVLRREDGRVLFNTAADLSTIHLPGSLQAAMTSRLDRLDTPPRELLQQCSVQGLEFDLRIARGVRQNANWSGPPIEPLVEGLNLAGLIAHRTEGDGERRRFTQELMRDACYETLLVKRRRELHGLIADAMKQGRDGAAEISAAMIAHHEENAERWGHAAQAHCDAADDAAALFLNDEALAGYDLARSLLDRLGVEDEAARGVHVQADLGAGRVLMRIGRYEEARRRIDRLMGFAQDPVESVEAETLHADYEARTGRPEDAALRLEALDDHEPDDPSEREAVSRACLDLARLHMNAGRFDDAIDRLYRARQLAGPSLGADLLGGLIDHTRGHFDEGRACYRQALVKAEALGAAPLIAQAANGLGNVSRDLGDYDAARDYYKQALENWSHMADAECIAGAHNNLGNVAMSVGDLDAAEDHYRDTLSMMEHIGNPRGVALARVNLGLLALEREDGAVAVDLAEQALARLSGPADGTLAALVRVVWGEGLLRCARIDRAVEVFQGVLDECAERDHPLAVSGARRGMGRACVSEGDAVAARRWLEQALEGFVGLSRVQEAERTRMCLAELALEQGDWDEAASLARVSLESCGRLCVRRDTERAKRLLALAEAKGAQTP